MISTEISKTKKENQDVFNNTLSSIHTVLIKRISSRIEKCLICEISLLNYEIFNCKSCYKIFHLECVIESCSEIDIGGFKKYTFYCSSCNNQVILDKKPFYNCYCGKYYEALKNKDEQFDPNLIPHGCGLICGDISKKCAHNWKCDFICHPGPHSKCKMCNTKLEEIDCVIETIKSLSLQSKTNIINLKGKLKLFGPSCEYDSNIIYCGRTNTMGGWKLKQSIWANPFKVTVNETNEIVCKKYEEYIRNKPELMDKLNTLVGKTLACWCVPNPCHTEILMKLMKEKNLI